MNTDWPLFATGAERAASRAAQACEPDSAEAALRLAWDLRQCEPQAARELLALCPEAALAPWLQARRALVEGELALAALQLDTASAWARRALAAMPDDAAVQADVAFLRYWISDDGGDGQVQVWAEAMREAARDEPRRRLLALCLLANRALLMDNVRADAEWAPLLPTDTAGLTSDCVAAVAAYHGLRAAIGADFDGHQAWLPQAYEAAVDAGHARRALTVISNMAYALIQANQYDLALSWLQRGLQQLHGTGLPLQRALLQARSADVLRHLGQLDAASDQIRQALECFADGGSQRGLAICLNVLGSIELDRGDLAASLAAHQRLGELARLSQATELIIVAGNGMARTLLALARAPEALVEIDAVLEVARRQAAHMHVAVALGVRAEVLAALPQRQHEALEAFEQALALGRSLPNFQTEARLLEAAARTHAAVGHYEQAYGLAADALAARERNFNNEIAKSTRGLREQHELERAAAENEHLRRQGELLKRHLEELQGLSVIGQEIATAAEAARVLTVLARHVFQALQPAGLAVSLLDERRQLRCAHAEPPSRADDGQTAQAQALREARELHEGVQSGRARACHLPLCVAGQALGVLSVWAGEAGLGERELLVLRALAGYGAIALANVQTYQHLSQVQQRLMQQERHAALGALVAGVSHELNTPIGNCLLVSDSLIDELRKTGAALEGGTLGRRALNAALAQQNDGLQIVRAGMQTAARLISSFKQVAVDQGSEARRRFALAQVVDSTVQTLQVALRRAGVSVEQVVPAELALDGFPGSLSQALMILVNNAMAHAFDGRTGGRVRIDAEAAEPGWMLLRVSDDGCGMNDAVRRRVFEPFFTTKFGQGGSGLGLSICHNLVNRVLGGEIDVQSRPGEGSRFLLRLPAQAPP
ncbi:ATP-binding protein [Roseateles sp. NT4]|uniref:ATP-binding protein n=1 Tax=Roseateles sp. NT4 TaxID=3453715 RepID=UPI003EE94A9B